MKLTELLSGPIDDKGFAYVAVRVAPMGALQEFFQAMGNEIEEINVLGLIDTGATHTVISADLGEKVSKARGIVHLRGIGSEEISQGRKFDLSLRFENGVSARHIEVAGHPRSKLGGDLIIGADLLAHARFVYLGKERRYELQFFEETLGMNL